MSRVSRGGSGRGRGATHLAHLALPQPGEGVGVVVARGDGLHRLPVKGDQLPVVGEDGGAQDGRGRACHEQRQGQEEARRVRPLRGHGEGGGPEEGSPCGVVVVVEVRVVVVMVTGYTILGLGSRCLRY